ncbi:hypothetical protein K402DRAFT_420450 [Aulographum hederae CBS 113979]|uniref:Zn(2)-C6 fungal-type domain-containing protein n=1 Tax=Aulographum hederae CBS 113979 TaxID=1176131 RepID=A0A6G1H1Y8_9PEZI|nr:hypothetical protein K402DRAFT_420450 [Aulographum hederae CBS 113979]
MASGAVPEIMAGQSSPTQPKSTTRLLSTAETLKLLVSLSGRPAATKVYAPSNGKLGANSSTGGQWGETAELEDGRLLSRRGVLKHDHDGPTSAATRERNVMFRNIQPGVTSPTLTSPVELTPASGSAQGKLISRRSHITAVACVPCKKRKTKCNGNRPACNTCLSRPTQCYYDMDSEHRWQGGLRKSVKRLEQELEDMKSILPLIAATDKRDAAIVIAQEIQQRGFADRSVDQMRRVLQDQARDTYDTVGQATSGAVEDVEDDPGGSTDRILADPNVAYTAYGPLPYAPVFEGPSSVPDIPIPGSYHETHLSHLQVARPVWDGNAFSSAPGPTLDPNLPHTYQLRSSFS